MKSSDRVPGVTSICLHPRPSSLVERLCSARSKPTSVNCRRVVRQRRGLAFRRTNRPSRYDHRKKSSPTPAHFPQGGSRRYTRPAKGTGQLEKPKLHLLLSPLRPTYHRQQRRFLMERDVPTKPNARQAGPMLARDGSSTTRDVLRSQIPGVGLDRENEEEAHYIPSFYLS